jgi:hypothetical protein
MSLSVEALCYLNIDSIAQPIEPDIAQRFGTYGECKIEMCPKRY